MFRSMCRKWNLLWTGCYQIVLFYVVLLLCRRMNYSFIPLIKCNSPLSKKKKKAIQYNSSIPRIFYATNYVAQNTLEHSAPRIPNPKNTEFTITNYSVRSHPSKWCYPSPCCIKLKIWEVMVSKWSKSG